MDNNTNNTSNLLLTMPEQMTIQSVDLVAQEWKDALLHHTGPVTVSLGQVETLSTAGIQLLFALGASLKQHHRSLQLTHFSDNARSACKDSGCLPLISQWMEQETPHA